MQDASLLSVSHKLCARGLWCILNKAIASAGPSSPAAGPQDILQPAQFGAATTFALRHLPFYPPLLCAWLVFASFCFCFPISGNLNTVEKTYPSIILKIVWLQESLKSVSGTSGHSDVALQFGDHSIQCYVKEVSYF